jgi:hypothetical protein
VEVYKLQNHLKLSKPIIGLAIICAAWITYVSHLFFTAQKPQLVMIALISLVISYTAMGWVNNLFKRIIAGFNSYLDSVSMEVIVGSSTGLVGLYYVGT